MKTNVLVKFAVVAMAAFGAYAFSGSNANDLEFFNIHEGGVCTMIKAGCSKNIQGPECKVLYNGTPTTVFDLECITPIRHDNSDYVEWEDL